MQDARLIQISQNVAALYRAMEYLPYRTYIYNRLLRPDITPERWKLIFPAEQVERFEPKLQQQMSILFREKLHRAQIALFKAEDHEARRDAIEFLSDLYIHIRLTHDVPPGPITPERLRELEADYLDARSAA